MRQLGGTKRLLKRPPLRIHIQAYCLNQKFGAADETRKETSKTEAATATHFRRLVSQLGLKIPVRTTPPPFKEPAACTLPGPGKAKHPGLGANGTVPTPSVPNPIRSDEFVDRHRTSSASQNETDVIEQHLTEDCTCLHGCNRDREVVSNPRSASRFFCHALWWVERLYAGIFPTRLTFTVKTVCLLKSACGSPYDETDLRIWTRRPQALQRLG